MYKKFKEVPNSIQILPVRWKLLGHILSLDPEIPASKAMKYDFTENPKRKNKTNGIPPMTTLPVLLNNQPKGLKNNTFQLTSLADLKNLRNRAHNRTDETVR